MYRIKAATDPFGCAAGAQASDDLRLPGNIDQLVESKGFGDHEVSCASGLLRTRTLLCMICWFLLCAPLVLLSLM